MDKRRPNHGEEAQTPHRADSDPCGGSAVTCLFCLLPLVPSPDWRHPVWWLGRGRWACDPCFVKRRGKVEVVLVEHDVLEQARWEWVA